MEELQNLTPLYNKEFYLAYLCGEDVELPIPDGNTEHYLAYLCGMDVPIPDPLYTKEFYLAYKCGMDVELPEPGPYRIDQYLAKWCGMDVEVPEPMYRIEYWLAQLANSGELKTVSGNPISVSDALARPAESLVIEILPQQSGSGDPSPDNVRPISGFTGVNIYRESAYDPDADPTYSISWQDEAGTVYGGTFNPVSGVMTVTMGMADLGESNFYRTQISESDGFRYYIGSFCQGNNGKIPASTSDSVEVVCSEYPKKATAQFNKAVQGITIYTNGSVQIYDATRNNLSEADFKTAMDGVQMAYELAMPMTYQLTPTEVQMLLGNNTIWNDVGDMTLEYLADGPADDVDALQILLGNRYVNNGGADEATDREALEILLGGNTR